MSHDTLTRYGFAAHIAATVTVVFLALLIVTAEETPPLKDWLKETFTHHWLGKGALGVMLFTLLTLLFAFSFRGKEIIMDLHKRAVTVLSVATVLSSTTLILYFLSHLLH